MMWKGTNVFPFLHLADTGARHINIFELEKKPRCQSWWFAGASQTPNWWKRLNDVDDDVSERKKKQRDFQLFEIVQVCLHSFRYFCSDIRMCVSVRLSILSSFLYSTLNSSHKWLSSMVEESRLYTSSDSSCSPYSVEILFASKIWI